MDLSNKIKAAAEYIKGKSKYNPTIGLILGSGLGAIADQIEDAEYFPYNEIPNFPVSTVEGHAGRLVIGKFQGKKLLQCKEDSTTTKVTQCKKLLAQ